MSDVLPCAECGTETDNDRWHMRTGRGPFCDPCNRAAQNRLREALGPHAPTSALVWVGHVRNVDDLAHKPDAELLTIDGVGVKRLAKIRAKVPYRPEAAREMTPATAYEYLSTREGRAAMAHLAEAMVEVALSIWQRQRNGQR